MGIWKRLLRLLQQKLTPAPPPSPPLDGVAVTVFVRQSNSSRTNLEHYIEQEMLRRGATVVIANQSAGLTVTQKGEWRPLALMANLTFTGTLTIEHGHTVERMEFTESEYEFEKRVAQHEVEFQKWANERDWNDDLPEPILEPRRNQKKQIAATNYQISFRIIDNDGVVFASGSVGKNGETSLPADSILMQLAEESVAHLDKTNIWSKIHIG